MDFHFLDELKIKVLQVMQSMGSNHSAFPVKKIMKYIFYIFITFGIIIYLYSIFFNIRQISIMKDTGNALQDILGKVKEESKNFSKGKVVEAEGSDKINMRDYIYNFYNYTQDISKTQTIPIIFKEVKIDEQKPNSVHFVLTFVKYLSIDKILKYSPSGKTFLKIRNLNVKYEYLQDYDLAYYTLTIDGDVIQYSDKNSNKDISINKN